MGLSLAYAAVVVLRRHGDWTSDLVPFRSSSVLYNAPVVAPLFLFLQERFRRRAQSSRLRIALDATVLALSASRMVIPVPWISGHALFLSYGMGTTRGLPVRAATALVLVGTAIVKIALWRDPSLVGGVTLGVGATLLWASRPFSVGGRG